jgi:hypothetical protein
MFGGSYIPDQDIVRLSTDKLQRGLFFKKFPFISKLPIIEASGDVKHYWEDGVEGIVTTQLNGAMTGGAATENVAVDSSAEFKVNQVVLIAHDGSHNPKNARISAIPDATHLTLVTLDAALLDNFADNTYVILRGDYVNYGTTINLDLDMPTRGYNVIEQISISTDVSRNVKGAYNIDNGPAMVKLVKDGMRRYKQKSEVAALFGEMLDPVSSTKKAQMDGLYNMIPGANIETGVALATATDKPHLRAFVQKLKNRDAFGDAMNPKCNWCVCNGAFVQWWTGLDDNTTGLSQKTTDDGFDVMLVEGVKFSVMECRTMTRAFPLNLSAAFLLTAREEGDALIKWARIPDESANGADRIVTPTAVSVTMQIAQFATIEVMDAYKDGLIISNTEIS